MRQITPTPDAVLDELLVLRSQGGDKNALELLARRWHRRLTAWSYRLTGDVEAAPEVTQEAWLAVVRSLGRLADPATFPAWVHRIVRRKAADWVRRRQRRRRLDDAVRHEAEAVPMGRPGAAAASTESDQREADLLRLRQGLATLPDEQRQLLHLFYLEGMGVRQVSRALDIPQGTVKSRLFRARAALKQILEDSP
jgi:RNA polymerase sigma-70 factor (ECF subfamily)